MKKIFISIILFLIFCAKSNAQYHMISDTSVVYPQIKIFLLKGLKDTIGIKIALLKQINLLDSADYDFGIFEFRKLSSEPGPYLYLRNYGETKITVIPKYHIDTVMKYLSSYFTNNKKYITYKQRLACTKKVVEILEAKLD
jgi:hypothetical protein